MYLCESIHLEKARVDSVGIVVARFGGGFTRGFRDDFRFDIHRHQVVAAATDTAAGARRTSAAVFPVRGVMFLQGGDGKVALTAQRTHESFFDLGERRCQVSQSPNGKKAQISSAQADAHRQKGSEAMPCHGAGDTHLRGVRLSLSAMNRARVGQTSVP